MTTAYEPIICPDCGAQYNPGCIGACEYHSGQCTQQPAPVKAHGKSWGWRTTALRQQEEIVKLRRENADLRKIAQEALGSAKGMAG